MTVAPQGAAPGAPGEGAEKVIVANQAHYSGLSLFQPGAEVRLGVRPDLENVGELDKKPSEGGDFRKRLGMSVQEVDPRMAESTGLPRQGALVAGIDWPNFKADLEADDAKCVFPDGDLENLSHEELLDRARQETPDFAAEIEARIAKAGGGLPPETVSRNDLRPKP